MRERRSHDIGPIPFLVFGIGLIVLFLGFLGLDQWLGKHFP